MGMEADSRKGIGHFRVYKHYKNNTNTMTNLLTISHIQKYIAVGVMAVAMFFGMFVAAPAANAQMAPEEMQSEIDRLMQLIEQLTSTIGTNPTPAGDYPQPEPVVDDHACYSDDAEYEAGERVDSIVTDDGVEHSGVYVCIDGTWETFPEAEEPGSTGDSFKESYNMSDVKKITSRFFNPQVAKQGDEFTKYRVVLNDGTVHNIKRVANTPAADFETQVRKTGYTGTMANFKGAIKKLIPVRNGNYYMGKVKSVTVQKFSTGGAKYTITLENGKIKTAMRTPTMNNTQFERAVRNTGFAGAMKNFNAAAAGPTRSIDTPPPYPTNVVDGPMEEVDSEGPEEVCDPTYCDSFPLSPTPAPAPESDPEAPGSSDVCDPTYCDSFPTSPDAGTSGTSGGAGSAGGSSYPGATGGSGTSGSTGGTSPSDTAVDKFYAGAILVVNRRDFYSDEAKTQLSYRRYAIKKTDGTTVVVKRNAGVNEAKFTEQLRAKGYYGTLENFQKKVVKLQPRVLGATTTIDSYTRWSYSIDDLESSMNAYLAPQVLGVSTSVDSYVEWSDSITDLEDAVAAYLK